MRTFPRQLRGKGKSLGGSLLARPNSDTPVMKSKKISGLSAMNEKRPSPVQRSVQTASGRISYTEQGTGPVALFVHGVLLSGYLWRHQLADLSDVRRCIAVDLLGHGDTEIAPDQDVSVTANAKMLKEFLDALNIHQVDLVGNICARWLRPSNARVTCNASSRPSTTSTHSPSKNG